MNDSHSNIQVLPRIKITHLTSADSILTELRSVYRAARRGELPIGDATKLTYILKVMSEIMTLREMEARLDCLEAGIPYQPRNSDGDDQADQEAH
jgi:hypothetical protein